MNMDTINKGIDFGDRLLSYEHQWVALDRENNSVIESAVSLTALLAKLTEEELNTNPTCMYVLPPTGTAPCAARMTRAGDLTHSMIVINFVAYV